MYKKFGKNAFNYFEGMFAFCIYDKLIKKTIIVRDYFGIKPLFFYSDNARFAFSSELKNIIKTGFKR